MTLQGENMKGLGWSVVKRMPKAGAGMHRYLRGKPKPRNKADDPMLWYAHEFAMDGGKVSWMDAKTIEDMKRDLERAISDKNIWKFLRYANSAGGLIENLNGAVENSTRLATYIELRERGVSRPKAALASKEVTTNFNKRGTESQWLNSIFLFFNARVQGVAQVYRALRNPRAHKLRVAAYGFLPAMGFLASFLNRLCGGDDDDGLNRWDHAVPQYEKEKNFIILTPWGKDIKIPMSFGYNVFVNIGQQSEAVMAHMLGYGDGVDPLTAVNNMKHSLVNATSPLDFARSGWAGMAPTLLAPFVEMAENATYQDTPIYPTKYNPRQSDAETFFPGVGPFWKGLAQELNTLSHFDKTDQAYIDWSPESMEHLFNTYAGGAGQFWWTQIGGNAFKLAQGAYLHKTPDIGVRDMPFVREVVGSTNSPYVRQNMYYDVWDKVETLHDNIKDKVITKSDARRKYPLEYKLWDEFHDTQQKLRDERDRRKKIDANTRLSAQERARRLDAINERMAKLRGEALQHYGQQLKRQRGAPLH